MQIGCYRQLVSLSLPVGEPVGALSFFAGTQDAMPPIKCVVACASVRATGHCKQTPGACSYPFIEFLTAFRSFLLVICLLDRPRACVCVRNRKEVTCSTPTSLVNEEATPKCCSSSLLSRCPLVRLLAGTHVRTHSCTHARRAASRRGGWVGPTQASPHRTRQVVAAAAAPSLLLSVDVDWLLDVKASTVAW